MSLVTLCCFCCFIIYTLFECLTNHQKVMRMNYIFLVIPFSLKFAYVNLCVPIHPDTGYNINIQIQAIASNTTPETLTSTTTMTTSASAGQCEKDSDCQDNAGCFDDPTNKSVKTCHCFLGYLLDNTTASFPKTGTCENLRTRACTGDKSKDYCITNTEGWGVCPYCRVCGLFINPLSKNETFSGL